jgi:flagellar motor protein MotB
MSLTLNMSMKKIIACSVAVLCLGAAAADAEIFPSANTGVRPTGSRGETAERHMPANRVLKPWTVKTTSAQSAEAPAAQEINRVKVCRTETVCVLRYKEGFAHRVQVKNLVPPLRYDNGSAEVPAEFIQRIGRALDNMSDKQNVVIKFIAHTDSQPLAENDAQIYADHTGFSKAMARRVAQTVRQGLGLPDSALEGEGLGALRPLAANDTQHGRRLNRRVEVEFWHDDAMQELPEEPVLCPDAAGAETVTRVHASLDGGLPPIVFEGGRPALPAGYTDRLRRAMDELAGKANVRLRFVGYTRNQRLDRRTAAVYGDDIGLSMARARRAMVAVAQEMGLSGKQVEFDGRGYVQSEDVVNVGFTESDTSRVEVQVVYDEAAVLDNYEGVEIAPLTREVQPVDPFALNLMRITVDGKPLDDPHKGIADIQRCTDVALDQAEIRFKQDNLKVTPRLNVTAWPSAVRYQDLPETAFAENLVHFGLYSNYRSFIARGEVRLFADEQSERDTPLAIVPLDADGSGVWRAEFETFEAPHRKLKYVARVYDKDGLFDETVAQSLWVIDRIDPATSETDWRKELLAGYGESRIADRMIPLAGGTVQVYGRAIPEGHGVWLAGFSVPVDYKGAFVAEEILPEGLHTVEVAVLNTQGSGELYLRDLTIASTDWFAVGIADLTFSSNSTNGPAKLLAPDKPQYSEDSSINGRLAFYSTSKFQNGWSLTASADTREGPVDELFSNFMDKSPDALFRRMDPDYHYPTFGDDSTVAEDAPTMGKFYLKAKKDESYGMWGNFKLAYTDTYLAQVDRGLYGANAHYQTQDATSFGEPRLLIDGYAADPGTIAGRDEFRGTNGSLYYLRRQDILEGSESVHIEVRDRDSGMVLAVKNLVPSLDYDIDYLQGRVLLTEPLPATAEDGMLVSDSSLGGHSVYLVVRYEYTPGFDDPDALATGGRAHYWIGDYIKIGVTTSQENADVDNNLNGADVTLRKSADSWLRVETARSQGPGVLTTTSTDGGYNFAGTGATIDEDVEASANRVDASVGMADLFENGRGRITGYYQHLEAGYSAPGLATTNEITQYGTLLSYPLTDRVGGRLKYDRRAKELGLETEAGEANVDYRWSDNWTVSAGARRDSREDHSPIVPATQEEGSRTDAVAKLLYDSRENWTLYGFGQETVEKTGNRDDNGRLGMGGSYRLTERFNAKGEISAGDLGMGGLLGTEYLYSDSTTLYVNYTLENERSDNGVLARKGNMVSGFRTRYSDSASAYLEERYAHGEVPTGLTHSTGVELSPVERLNLGAHVDFGTLKDYETAAEIERRAAGVSVGYGFERLKLASGVEYRQDDTEQPDRSSYTRTTWLWKNSFKYQMSEDWRLLGKFNYAESESTQGQYYSGDYTEAVLGSAFRPVAHDRLNALFKYTYFYNMPAADQLTGSGNRASDFVQRSHIMSVDAMYDLTERWTVGGKYAYRHGQVAIDREDPEFFDSRAHLYVLRADWQFIHYWDALFEVRRLDLPDAQDRRDGFLVALYRHLGDHIKVGVGYNFSDFSDDLTQLSYEHQGLFVNLIGKF